MILNIKKADIKDTTEIPVEGLEGVFLEVRTTFKESEISKVLSANSNDGFIEAQDIATMMFLKGWKGVTDEDGEPIKLKLRNNVIDLDFFELIPQVIKEPIFSYFVDQYALKNDELKNS
jgi:hypothetical protein